jgi:class 3 adenylate cyclase
MASAQRRLSAILHADLAEFVRLVENEEDLTFQRLYSVRAEVLRPAIESAGGAVVHSAGDSILVEFNTARAAVQAAIDIQERMSRFNAGLAEEQRLLFRIGVHLGEIIVDEKGHDIFGDGVNLAERIQTMAEPGGIAVSRAVRDIADLADNYTYVDGGEQRAKHVSRPIHVFAVRARDYESTSPSPVRPVRGTLRFRGADHAGRKFGFDLPVEALKQGHDSVVIGRDYRQCEVVLAHSTVSRRHARLSVAANSNLQIEDLGSTNGTFIEGEPVPHGARHVLAPGARLKLGDVELVVQYD